MRKIQLAISSDLCIRLTWNLTGSCGQQQTLRGWSHMVVKQFQGGGRPPFWKSIYRHISVKNHPIFMKFCAQQQILNWMNVTWCDQKWKFPKFKTADGRHFENRYIAMLISAKNHPISMKFCTQQQILNWMNVTWSQMKKLHWTDSRVRQNVFLVFSYVALNTVSTNACEHWELQR